MITNDDLLAMLRDIHGMVVSGAVMPSDDDPPLDVDLLFALGQIGGLAMRAIVMHRNRILLKGEGDEN